MAIAIRAAQRPAKDLCGPEGAGCARAKNILLSLRQPTTIGCWDSKRFRKRMTQVREVSARPDLILRVREVGSAVRRFEFPTAVATAGNQLFVMDFDNSRVLIWNKLPTKTNTPADVVVGQADFNAEIQTTTQSGLDRPETGLFVAGGKLFVSDRNNNRVMIWNKIPEDKRRECGCCGWPARFYQ